MKEIKAYILGTIIGLLPIIMLVSYFTYSEKVVMPITMIIIIAITMKLRKEK